MAQRVWREAETTIALAEFLQGLTTLAPRKLRLKSALDLNNGA